MTPVFFTDRDLGHQFPDIRAGAGLGVERHADHFRDNCPDSEWLATVGRKGWIAITHNSRIRYTPNELRAVRDHEVGLLIVIGQGKYADLARSFVNTRQRIADFIATHERPYIGKVYRPAPSELALREDAPGRVELWWPPAAN